MSEANQISTKKVIRFTIGLVLVAIFMVALIAASVQQNNKHIKALDVRLNDENNYSFLQKKDIEQLLLTNRSINLKSTTLEQLDLKKMESIAKTNPWVAKADVFIDSRQVLQVNITQREPVCRIFDVRGSSYYMDSSLNIMPLSNGYAYPSPVFTNVPVWQNDSLNKSMRSKMAYLSQSIARDSFWNAQITQIEVSPEQHFIMNTLFGHQRILLGDTSKLQEKLKHLFAFYKDVSSKIGWDKYETLDVRYKGQVIASPSIGWVPPKVTDTASLPLLASSSTAPKAPVANAVAKPKVINKETSKTAVKKPTEKVKVNPAANKKVTPSKPLPSKAVTKEKTTNKEKTSAQATSKAKDKKTNPENKSKTKSPKYIYPGK